jgi:hypothetical protein
MECENKQTNKHELTAVGDKPTNVTLSSFPDVSGISIGT